MHLRHNILCGVQAGTPADLAPYRDIPEWGDDKNINNNFDYSVLDPHDQNGVPGQFRCPFAAHVRNTAPRKGTGRDLGKTPEESQRVLEESMIMRTAIAYGPELTPEEQTQTKVDRGLAFVCYQAVLANGFRRLQNTWMNTPRFPPQAQVISDVPPGFEPVLGSNKGRDRDVSGIFVPNFNQELDLPADWVVARGGEYFFVPSMTALGIIASGGKLGPN